MKRESLALYLLFTVFGRIVVGQESNYLAQKLMLENDLRKRIDGALEKILDDHRYVLDISAELKFTPTVKEEVTFSPTGESPPLSARSPEREKAMIGTPDKEPGREKSRLTGIPIPGFDFQVMEDETSRPSEMPTQKPEEKANAKASGLPSKAKVIAQSYTDITASMPVIQKLSISCILPEGSSPELVENVRQIIMVASHFDRSRGDEMSIMTASFRERKDQRTAESIILRSIAEKIDKMQGTKGTKAAKEEADWRKELQQWRDEEARRRNEERAVFLAELKKLEDERVRKQYEMEKSAVIERDSLKIASLTNEINQLKALLGSADLTTEQAQTASQQINSKERERARLDSLLDEKLALLQDSQSQLNRLEGGISNLPIYLMSAISLLAVLALAAVIIFNGRKPRYVAPPPWMLSGYWGKKKVKKAKTVGGETIAEKPASLIQAGVAPRPEPLHPAGVSEDAGVLQSEIKSIRQSIVSMTAAQPEAAGSIVKDWLQESAVVADAETPTPAEPQKPVEEKPKEQKKKK